MNNHIHIRLTKININNLKIYLIKAINLILKLILKTISNKKFLMIILVIISKIIGTHHNKV